VATYELELVSVPAELAVGATSVAG